MNLMPTVGITRASCVAPTSCSRRRSAGRRAPPHAVRRLLRRTLALRERRERGELEGRGLRIALDRLEAHTDRARGIVKRCGSAAEGRLGVRAAGPGPINLV